MWYFSLRFGKSQRIAVLALALAAAAYIGGKRMVATSVFQPETVPAAIQTMEISGTDMTERTDFLANHGFTAHGEVQDTVTIPSPFDAVYESYNALQNAQGFDLLRYRGKEVQRFRYPVTGDFGEGVATLLVYKNRIIGGDLSAGGERLAIVSADPER